MKHLTKPRPYSSGNGKKTNGLKTRQDRDYGKMISRRALMLGGAQLGIFSLLAWRVYYLQIAQGQEYRKLADDNRYAFRIIEPSRGRIYDAAGRLLAGNAESYQLSIVPGYAGDMRRVLGAISRLVTLPERDIEEILEVAEKQPSFLPVEVRSDLNQREVARLVVRNPELPGVSFDKAEKRIYPQGALTCHLIGYVNRVTRDEIEAGDISRELAHISTGKTGVERAFENSLRGAPGRKRVTVNAAGRPVRSDVYEQSESGADISLAMDIGLQLEAVRALKQAGNRRIPRNDPRVAAALANDPELPILLPEEEQFAYLDARGRVVGPETGSVVVVDVKTGAVRCLAATPGFDPNIFTGRIGTAEWERMVNHPRRPLLDRSVAGQYPPGSTFKMVVALAALEAGVINGDTHFTCPGYHDVGNKRFHCWEKKGHGRLDPVSAIEQSCDVFFYNIGIRTGIARIAAMARRLGFGSSTGLDLVGEKQGVVPDTAWQREAGIRLWTRGETANVSIGQGYMLATPLQIAMMTARIANGAERVMPNFGAGDAFPREAAARESLGIDPAHLELVRRGMRRVMSGARGTARASDVKIDGKGVVAGKTGTVQVRRITREERDRGITDNVDRQWKWRDHSIFTAFAPYEDPRYAIAVVVEHGGSGSGMAAPVAKKVLTRLLRADAAAGGSALS